MSNRMDKYNHSVSDDVVPKRSEKNKELYKQIYNAYDEFENLVVPSNAKEIDINDLKKEISSRDEYRQARDVESITNTRIKRIDDEDDIAVEEKEKSKQEEVYDINELLDKAISSNKKETTIEPTLSSGDYLKRLKLDRTKTNLEQVKEMYNSMESDLDNNEELLKTANLSLEILSDLKGNDDNTAVSAIVNTSEIDDIIADKEVIDEEKEEIEDTEDFDFYSTNYKFSKKDFEGKKDDNIDKKLLKKESSKEEDDDEDEEDDEEEEFEENGHSALKIFLLIFGILLVVSIVVYLIIYFGKN